MASLIIVSSLFQFLLSARLSLLRRIFTSVITGTVIIPIAATVMPFVFQELSNVPEGAAGAAAPVAAGVTLVIVGTLVLWAPPSLRLWPPLIGVIAGCAVSAPFGLYNFELILDAPWVGIPHGSWPGIELTPGHEFWALLPAFVVVTLVGAIETIGDGVAIQRVSRREQRATDFRVVQGALIAVGMGNLLSGIAGTPPNTTYSSSISLAEVTGIADRRVGTVIGIVFIVVAFFPKLAALVIAIPGPVAAAYVTILIGLLFMQGMKIIIEDGLDHRKAAVVGLAFWLGTGFQNGWILPDLWGDGFAAVLLGNGMTSGALVAVVMILFLELTRSKRRRLQVTLASESLHGVYKFLREFASRAAWNPASQDRLASADEETLAILMQDNDEVTPLRLTVTASSTGNSVELEFVTSPEGKNVEDHLAHLRSLPPAPNERELSFRLLLYYASSVRQQKYHDVDVLMVTMEAPGDLCPNAAVCHDAAVPAPSSLNIRKEAAGRPLRFSANRFPECNSSDGASMAPPFFERSAPPVKLLVGSQAVARGSLNYIGHKEPVHDEAMKKCYVIGCAEYLEGS